MTNIFVLRLGALHPAGTKSTQFYQRSQFVSRPWPFNSSRRLSAADVTNSEGCCGRRDGRGAAHRHAGMPLRRTRSCESVAEQKKLKIGGSVDELRRSNGTTEDGFVGDVGRWQQRLGITVEDRDESGTSGGVMGMQGGDGLHHTTSPGPTVTARDLMNDGVLQEAFAARGRHKKSPVLAREVGTKRTRFPAWARSLLVDQPFFPFP